MKTKHFAVFVTRRQRKEAKGHEARGRRVCEGTPHVSLPTLLHIIRCLTLTPISPTSFFSEFFYIYLKKQSCKFRSNGLVLTSPKSFFISDPFSNSLRFDLHTLVSFSFTNFTVSYIELEGVEKFKRQLKFGSFALICVV